MAPTAWHILTGEYPPQAGGVGDYTAQVAAGLAAAGSDVHVWTSSVGDAPTVPGVSVHRTAGAWAAADLARLGDALDAFPTPRRLLVQHTPNAWGYRGLNLGFCRWLVGRRRDRGDEVRLMFHEVAYPWLVLDRPTRWLLAAGQRWMARTLLRAASAVDVTTPAWERMLRAVAPGDRRAIGWRPVPSNIAVADAPAAVAALRGRIAPRGETVVGSFSSFSELTGPLLADALPRVLLDQSDRVGLLIGQGGDRIADRLTNAFPALKGRVFASGPLAAAEVSTHLQASDLMIQLYPDGLTTRRTSLMAALAHGVPVVSNAGHLTEPFWAKSGAVAVAADLGRVAGEADRLLSDPGERGRVGASGRALYQARFALERTVEALNGTPVRVPS